MKFFDRAFGIQKQVYLALIFLMFSIFSLQVSAQCTAPTNVKAAILTNNTLYAIWQYSGGITIAYNIKLKGSNGTQITTTAKEVDMVIVDNYITWFAQQAVGLNPNLNYTIEVTPSDACHLTSTPADAPRDFVFTSSTTQFLGGGVDTNIENIEIIKPELGGQSINTLLKNGGTYTKKIDIAQLLSCTAYANHTIKAINVRGIYRNTLYSSANNSTLEAVTPMQPIEYSSCELTNRAEISQFSTLTQGEFQGNNVYNAPVKRRIQFTAQNPTNSLQEIEIEVKETYRSPVYNDCSPWSNPVTDPQALSAEYARWGVMVFVYVTLNTTVNDELIEKTIPLTVYYTLKTMCNDKDFMGQNGGKTTEFQNADIIVYPNPVQNAETFSIAYYYAENEPAIIEASMFDMHGKQVQYLGAYSVFEEGNNNRKVAWEVARNELQSGIYALVIKNKTTKQQQHAKIIVY